MINVNQPSEGGNFKRYIGLVTMNVLGMNLTKAELESIGIKADNEPEYASIGQKEDGSSVYKLRVEFVLGKQIGEGESAENIIVRHSFFLEGDYAYNKDKTEVQLIDQFGISRNFPIPDVQAGTFENEYMDKASAQVALAGEADLIKFIRCIASSKSKVDPTTLVMLTRGQKDKMEIFTDYSYLKEVVNHIIGANQAPVKVLLGIRRKDDKSYQDVFPFYFARPFEDATNFFSRLQNIAKSGSQWMANRFYGNIDFNAKKAHEEQFRLRIFEEEEESAHQSVSIPGLPTGLPAMNAAPAPAMAPAMAPPVQAAQPVAAPAPHAPSSAATPMAAPAPTAMPAAPGLPPAMQPPQQTAQQAAVTQAFAAPAGPSVF